MRVGGAPDYVFLSGHGHRRCIQTCPNLKNAKYSAEAEYSVKYLILPIVNYSVFVEYLVHYSEEHFSRNRFWSVTKKDQKFLEKQT